MIEFKNLSDDIMQPELSRMMAKQGLRMNRGHTFERPLVDEVRMPLHSVRPVKMLLEKELF